MEDMGKNMGWKAESKTGAVAAGSADAAAATIFTLNVTDHMECSIGGEVPIIYHDARTQTAKVLSGQEAIRDIQGRILRRSCICWCSIGSAPF